VGYVMFFSWAVESIKTSLVFISFFLVCTVSWNIFSAPFFLIRFQKMNHIRRITRIFPLKFYFTIEILKIRILKPLLHKSLITQIVNPFKSISPPIVRIGTPVWPGWEYRSPKLVSNSFQLIFLVRITNSWFGFIMSFNTGRNKFFVLDMAISLSCSASFISKLLKTLQSRTPKNERISTFYC